MANQKLLKKVAPVVLSAAMAMTSMPAAAMAADFSDSDVVSDAVDVEETQDAEAEVEVDEDDADDTADVDVVEDNAADAAEADEDAAGDEQGPGGGGEQLLYRLRGRRRGDGGGQRQERADRPDHQARRGGP